MSLGSFDFLLRRFFCVRGDVIMARVSYNLVLILRYILFLITIGTGILIGMNGPIKAAKKVEERMTTLVASFPTASLKPAMLHHVNYCDKRPQNGAKWKQFF